MGKILAIDIGGKRCGLAETDPLQIIATAVGMVGTDQLMVKLEKSLATGEYEAIVLGDPVGLDGGDSHNSARVREWKTKLEAKFPKVAIHLYDERFSSKIALQRMIERGSSKKARREKGNVDAESAAVILEGFLASR